MNTHAFWICLCGRPRIVGWRSQEGKSDMYIITRRFFKFQEQFVEFLSICFVRKFKDGWNTKLSIWIQKRFGFVCVVVPKCIVKHTSMEDWLWWLGQCKCISSGKFDMYIVAGRILKFHERFVKFLSIGFVWKFEDGWNTKVSIWIKKHLGFACVVVSQWYVKHATTED